MGPATTAPRSKSMATCWRERAPKRIAAGFAGLIHDLLVQTDWRSMLAHIARGEYSASHLSEAKMSDSDGPNLPAYFGRIGYGGATEPTLEVLSNLVRSHTATIPYEGIDVFLDRRIELSLEALERKLIHRRRGGYCFEHNTLFRAMLRKLGYKVDNLIGRTLMGLAPGAPPSPRGHLALKVSIDGEDWLIDVGNGAFTPTAPLLWHYDELQSTPHGDYRLVQDGTDTRLQLETADGVRPIFSLSPDPHLDVDFEPHNWYVNTLPTFWLRQNFVCAMSPDTARVNLMNDRLTVRRLNAPPEEIMLDAEGVEHCLTEVFGLTIEPGWRECLQEMVADQVRAREQASACSS